jgi:hypothetical protein
MFLIILSASFKIEFLIFGFIFFTASKNTSSLMKASNGRSTAQEPSLA